MTPTRRLSAYLLSTIVVCTALPLPVLSAQAPDSSRTGARHPRTCVKGLKEYKQLSDVPSPFEILRLEIAPTAVDPAGFRTFMLEQFAEHGATGFVAQPSQTAGEQTFFGFVPLYVPADSARVEAACRPATGGVPVPPGPHDLLGPIQSTRSEASAVSSAVTSIVGRILDVDDRRRRADDERPSSVGNSKSNEEVPSTAWALSK